jgi:hypothetical protein
MRPTHLLNLPDRSFTKEPHLTLKVFFAFVPLYRHDTTLPADTPEPPVLLPAGSWLARRLQSSNAATAVLAGLAHALAHGSKSQGFCLVPDEQTIGESWKFFFDC